MSHPNLTLAFPGPPGSRIWQFDARLGGYALAAAEDRASAQS